MVSQTIPKATSFTVVAAANNAEVMLLWNTDGITMPADALGFQIERINMSSQMSVTLESEHCFPGMSGASQPTNLWPVQGFMYFDDAPPQGQFQYKLTLMQGTPGSLQPSTTVVALSNVVSTVFNGKIQPHFNNGRIASQLVSQWIEKNCAAGALDQASQEQAAAFQQALSGAQPAPTSDAMTANLQPLVTALNDANDPLRATLSCGFIEFAEKLMLEAATIPGGHIFDASYELTDHEWLDFLCDPQHAALLSIILTDIPDGENDKSYAAIKATAATTLFRKLVNKYGIAHNKTEVLAVINDNVTKALKAKVGADNKTMTGFCAQISNSILFDDETLAGQILDYWNELQKDTQAGSNQGPALRQFCGTLQPTVQIPNGDGTFATVQAMFAPNTPTDTRPQVLTLCMQQLQDHLDQLPDGSLVLSNLFGPGHPGAQDLILAYSQSHPNSVCKVAVNGSLAMPANQTKQDSVFVMAQALHAPFANLLREILGVPHAFAYIHSKTVVTWNCVTKVWTVFTGTHNMGVKADTDNDEVMVQVTGAPLVGLAYCANNAKSWFHYEYRYLVNNGLAGTGYLATDNSWATLNADDTKVRNVFINALS